MGHAVNKSVIAYGDHAIWWELSSRWHRVVEPTQGSRRLVTSLVESLSQGSTYEIADRNISRGEPSSPVQ